MISEVDRLIDFPPTMMIVSMITIAIIDRQDIRVIEHHRDWYNSYFQDMQT